MWVLCGPCQTCYVQCMIDAIAGPAGDSGSSGDGIRAAEGPAKGMTRQELLELFGRAFRSSDPAKGGCPDVPVPAVYPAT